MTAQLAVMSGDSNDTLPAVVSQAAEHIRGLQRSLAGNVVEIGKALIDVKEALPHGQFLPWLKAEFEWSERTANNFMSVAERFGANPQPVAALPLKTVYALAAPSTPPELRERIVERLGAGEKVSPNEIAGEITRARREAARDLEDAKKKAKRSPEAKKREAVSRERQQSRILRERIKLDAERERRQGVRRAAAEFIVKRLGRDVASELAEMLADLHLDRQDLLAALRPAS